MGMLACARDMPERDHRGPGRTSFAPGTSPEAGDFEDDEAINPKSVLPAALLESPYHHVEAMRLGDDFIASYRIASDFGPLVVSSVGLLRKRVHEIEVLAALREHDVANAKVYALAVANAAEGPLEGASQFLVHPIRTTAGIPRGLWAYARVINEMRRGERTYLEDDYVEELMGFAKAKREWAYRTGVDVYTANPILSEMLDRYGWLSLAGGMTVRLPLIAVPGAASIALTVSSTGDDMKRELRDLAPEDLRMIARAKLRAMQIEDSAIEEFLHHPWYSPSRQIWLTEALARLDRASGRASFLAMASNADDPLDTFISTRLALMLAAYDRRVERIASIRASEGVIVAVTSSGEPVVPLYLDFGIWRPGMRDLLDRLERTVVSDSNASNPDATMPIALISGNLSELSRRRFAERGWRTCEGIETSWLEEWDSATFEPADPDADRIIPEIGG